MPDILRVASPAATTGSEPGSASNTADRLLASRRPRITPEIVSLIETAATAFAGKKMRVVSVKLASQAESNAWARQGRSMIHSSHNIVQQGH